MLFSLFLVSPSSFRSVTVGSRVITRFANAKITSIGKPIETLKAFLGKVDEY